jgi:pimeloyl-ACP methyl ester carboxylesterase
MHRFITLLCLLSSLAAQPLAASPVSLTREGLTLNAELVTAGENWAGGPVVLMTHGTLAHNGMEIIKGLQRMLKERGVSSLAINLGLGLDRRPSTMYDCPTPHTHKHADAVDEIGAWLGWLKEQGARKVALLGHSRGGNQTAWFAAERPDPAVVGVYLIAPGGWGDAHDAEDYRKRYGKDLSAVLEQARSLVAAGKPKQLIQPVDFIYCEQTAASAEAILGYYAPEQLRDTGELLPKISVPVVVFVGSEDTVVKGLAENMASLADGEHIRLEVADGADHFFRDLYSEDIADLIAEEMGP